MNTFDLKLMSPSRLTALFEPNLDTTLTPSQDGLVLRALKPSRDPSVKWHIRTMLTDAGIPGDKLNAAGIAALVFRVKSDRPGYFEVYCTAGDVRCATAYHCTGEEYMGGGQWEYVTCDLRGLGERWQGDIVDNFRVDWTGWCRTDDTMIIDSIYVFEDSAEAAAFAAAGNKDRVPFMPDVRIDPETPEKLPVKGFYVCLYEKQLASVTPNVLVRTDTLEEAVAVCEQNKVLGYRVADENGRLAYTPYTLLQCDILREGKYVTDYARENGFKYGDAPINPGIDNTAKLVSCDRLVCWVLYRLGFVRQPYASGVVVSAFPQWCRRQGFTLLTDYEALEPGDVMLVRPHRKGWPQHAFLFAGYADKPENDPDFPAQVADPEAPAGPAVPLMYAYRYDCGSDRRIQSVQPSQEKLFYDAYTPVELYRPVVTRENNVNWKRYLRSGGQ
ncbi:MAG: hypothetical protein MJ192_09460 [Clostridia bacterium]|nr:hypothetical protein [Clostridia bacterium]